MKKEQNSKRAYRVGILSMQKVINYGSFLQAFALMQTIKKLRPKAEILFIDIKPGKLLYEKEETNNSILQKAKNILKKIKILRYIQIFLFDKTNRVKAELIFNKYWHKYLGITNENNWNTFFDTVVIGSDEVFNCLQNSSWGFAKNLLGEELNSRNIITYAASCGATTVSRVENISLQKEVEKAFANIKQFSVRDENTFQFVKRLADKEAFIHLDPVFLFNYNDYAQMNKQLKKRFILVYAYGHRINKKEEIDAICDFAKANHLEIISLYGYQFWCKNLFPKPFELLAYFKQADYVATDTFHGTVFSIKYNKQFVSFVRYDNIDKLQYLLSKFDLQDREIKDVNSFSEKLKQKIDYEPVNKMIDEEIKKSFEYLDKYL